MKKAISIFCIVMITITLASCGRKSITKNLTYNDVLDVCCEAFNKGNEKKLSDFIYEGFGNKWNNENIIQPFSDFEDEDLPLENKIERYDIHETASDLKKLQDWIFEETNHIIEFDKAIEISMDNDSCLEICLVMIDEKWYILYFDL